MPDRLGPLTTMRRSSRIWGGVAIAGGILIAGSAIIYATGPAGRSASDLNAEIKAARAEGLWTSWRDIPSASSIPADQNAGPVYTAECSKIVTILGKDEKEFEAARDAVYFGAPTPTEIQTFSAGLAKLAPTLAVIESATARPQCIFQRNWELGTYVMFPEYGYAKSTARLLATRAVLEAEHGEIEESTHSLLSAARLCRHIGDEPILISSLVEVANEAILDRAMERIIDHHPTDLTLLSGVREAVVALGPPMSLRHALQAELPMTLTAMDGLAKHPTDWNLMVSGSNELPGSSVEPNLMGRLVAFGPVRDALKVNLIQYWREIDRRLPQDSADYEKQSIVMKDMEQTLDADKRWNSVLTKISAPVFSQSTDSLGKSLAIRRIRLAQISVLISKAKTGKYPLKLDGKAADLIDPFGQQPLNYKRTLAGFKVYSIGADRVDDGGLVRSSNDSGTYDLVASYPAPVRVQKRKGGIASGNFNP